MVASYRSDPSGAKSRWTLGGPPPPPATPTSQSHVIYNDTKDAEPTISKIRTFTINASEKDYLQLDIISRKWGTLPAAVRRDIVDTVERNSKIPIQTSENDLARPVYVANALPQPPQDLHKDWKQSNRECEVPGLIAAGSWVEFLKTAIPHDKLATIPITTPEKKAEREKFLGEICDIAEAEEVFLQQGSHYGSGTYTFEGNFKLKHPDDVEPMVPRRSIAKSRDQSDEWYETLEPANTAPSSTRSSTQAADVVNEALSTATNIGALDSEAAHVPEYEASAMSTMVRSRTRVGCDHTRAGDIAGTVPCTTVSGTCATAEPMSYYNSWCGASISDMSPRTAYDNSLPIRSTASPWMNNAIPAFGSCQDLTTRFVDPSDAASTESGIGREGLIDHRPTIIGDASSQYDKGQLYYQPRSPRFGNMYESAPMAVAVAVAVGAGGFLQGDGAEVIRRDSVAGNIISSQSDRHVEAEPAHAHSDAMLSNVHTMCIGGEGCKHYMSTEPVFADGEGSTLYDDMASGKVYGWR
ncbi:hypothetical protein MBLNU459_g5451t2 [Dothideomycetes sp. NU459]